MDTEQTQPIQPKILETLPTKTHVWPYVLISLVSTAISIVIILGLILTYIYYRGTNSTNQPDDEVVTPTVTTTPIVNLNMITIDSTSDPYYITQIELTYPEGITATKTHQATSVDEDSIVTVNNSEIAFRSLGVFLYDFSVFNGLEDKPLRDTYLLVLTKKDTSFSYYTIGYKNTWDMEKCTGDIEHCYFEKYDPSPFRWDSAWDITYKIPIDENQDQLLSIIQSIKISSSTLTLEYQGQLKDDYYIEDQANYYKFVLYQDPIVQDPEEQDSYYDYRQVFVVKKELIDSLININNSDIGKRFVLTGNFMPIAESPDAEGKFYQVNSIVVAK